MSMKRFPCYNYHRGACVPMGFIFHVVLSILLLLCGHGFWMVSGRCLDSEREALTTFRKSLIDPSNLLSSWDWNGDDDIASDCCKWRGVSCDDTSRYVVKLDLHNDNNFHYLHGEDEPSDPATVLSGRIHPALLELKHLQFLDLSFNNFNGLPIPEFLGSMEELSHLNLSKAGFKGRIPYQLGNLSNLVSLQLWSHIDYSLDHPLSFLNVENLWWLPNITSLKYLDMSFVNLSLASHTWVHIMNQVPSLVELRLPYCALSDISPSLSFVNFTSLRVLDLYSNNFKSRIPSWVANISSLVSLDLSDNYFHGLVPYQFSQLPNLEDLALGAIYDNLTPNWSVILEGSWSKLKRLELHFSHLYGGIPESISNITSLVSLDLSFTEETRGSIPGTIPNLVNLEYFSLYAYDTLGGVIPAGIDQLKHLSYLDLSSISLTGSIPAALGRLFSLQYLDLSGNNFIGTIPETLGGLSSLEVLSLARNQLNGIIPAVLGQLSKLKALDISQNNLTGPIPEIFGGLSSLIELDLASNKLNGTIPAALGRLSNLNMLHISDNSLTGPMSAALGKLSNLTSLILASNNLTGIVSENHFENLAKLNYLDLSSNSLALDLRPDWIPPFQLIYIDLRSCHMGPRFPLWLQTQKRMEYLDISNVSISDVMPSWFWDLTQQLGFLNLSHNMISGQLPNTLKMDPQASIFLSSNLFSGPIPCLLNGAQALDVSNNKLSGPIPPNFTNAKNSLRFFSISGNQISGKIPSSIGEMNSLTVLDLSRNNISGSIPSSLGDCVSLKALDLSRNHLSGQLCKSLGQLIQLQSIHLSDNGLSGRLPKSLRNCSSLETFDLGNNKLSGSIPAWIGKSFPSLKILRLRSNNFTGGIPPQLSLLTCLQILDVGHNELSGSIPQTFQNLTAMKDEKLLSLPVSYGFYYEENLLVSLKGQTLEFTSTISLVTCMDLSSNNLSGEIPEGITSLPGLYVLNLSGNHFSGKIPDEIGRLASLESLDFSRNQLSGVIPPSLSDLHFLSWLNLSYNNLSGRIPSGNQLRALPDPSIYIGNAGLCGPPLIKECDGDEASEGPSPITSSHVEDDGSDLDLLWFNVGIGTGFLVGFWGICVCLL